MKRSWLTLGLLLACSVTVCADDPRAKFQWSQPLEGEFSAGTLYRATTPPEVFDGCEGFPGDIRIIDENGEQWPFYVWVPSGSRHFEAADAQNLNSLVVDSPERYLRQDLRILPDPATGKPRPHNQISLQTPGHDFIRRVEVYGSDGDAVWGLLGSGYVVNHSRDAHAANDTITYPLSTLPLLQARLFPNARNLNETLAIERLSAGMWVSQPGEQQTVSLRETEISKEERRKESQVLIFDTGARGQPLEQLVIRAAENDYARSVKISGRNENTASWQWVADGEIHRIGKDVQDTVGIKETTDRLLKVEIFHYDDRPLTQVQVEAIAVPRYLVFEAGSGHSPVLYFGAGVEAPRYDLERRKGREAVSSAPVVKLRARAANPMHKTTTVSSLERHQHWLAILAVGISSLLVLWVILGMLRKQAGSS